MTPPARPSVAVVGGGVAGLTAAYLLRNSHQVTLYEADSRLGGHAHTHQVTTADGQQLAIDSGFIVHNERTYPHLVRLFGELGVQTQATEMSLSITCDGCGLSYAGGRGLAGIFAQRRRVADPRFLRMIREVPRFHRAARGLLGSQDDGMTWGEFLAAGRYSDYFIQHFAVPLVACVWSAGASDALNYPARHLFVFLDNHGMLTVKGSPSWRTVTGGSAAYVERLASRLPEVRAGAPVTAIERHDDGVDLRETGQPVRRFDRVVVATHADQALALLADADATEKELLGAFEYSSNETWLHRDGSVLPPRSGARSSWNYRMRACEAPEPAVQVSYWMNRLHGLAPASAGGPTDDYVVTLNPDAATISQASVVSRMHYQHPVFTRDAVAAAEVLRAAGGPRLAFAGAHLGWGFHEDGARSGVEAAASFGGTW